MDERKRSYKKRARSSDGSDGPAKKAKMGGKVLFPMARLQKIEKKVSLLQGQVKKFDQAVGPSNTGGTSALAVNAYLSGIARGAGETEREGNRILVKNVNMRGLVARNAAGNNTQVVRIVVLADTQNAFDQVAWTWADVYGTDICSHFNVEHAGRYKLLAQKYIVVGTNENQVMPFEINWKGNLSIRYNGANAGDSDKNAIFMLAISDTYGSPNGPSIYTRCRISYVDN